MKKPCSTLLSYILYLAISLVLAVSSGCNLPKAGQALTPTGDFASTAAAQTVSALTTQFASMITSTPPSGLETSLPTQPSTTFTPAESVKPCERAEFVSDVSVPDGSQFSPGQTFIKTWRLKNTGSCTWTTSYRVVFESGNVLGAPPSFNLPVSVPPDALVDISVNMKAPDQPREYESYWKLQNPQGVIFGLGSNGDKSFWVKIKVVAPTQMP
ncbi:MAG: NBR1-Ig-like domain-containing protein [Bellilinea sp.]|nr:NBR1-Ig-like domain-containing protein [Bellilinea sp.]